ncbi:MAG: hypothetical protein GX596_05165 [Propionibacterium sp.]|nr:hypothetical protein [Propionibacterium sp.]
MMHRRPGIQAGAIATAVALAACSGGAPPGPGPASVVAERLSELSGTAEEFSSLAVGREDLLAHTAEGDELQIWDLTEGLEFRDTFGGRYPAVPFEQLDADAIQAEVEALVAECDVNVRVTVNAVTPSAHVTEMRCGEASFLELVATDPKQVHLAGEPLPDGTAVSVEETWEYVLALVARLDPDEVVSRVEIDDEEAYVWMSGNSATNDCVPSFSFARDGSDLGWACFSNPQGPPIPLGTMEAAELAGIQRAVMTEAGIDGTDGLEVTVGTSSATGAPALRVQLGPSSAEAPLR